MAAGGEDFDAETVMGAVLAGMQNEVYLHSQLQEATKPYLLSFISQETKEALMADLPKEPEEWMITFSEAWEAVSAKMMPSVMSRRAEVWSGKSAQLDAAAHPPPR